ncbi:hypothetical protein [Desulfovulcanus sp.]
MFSLLKRLWQQHREKKELKKSIEPHEFQKMAQEILIMAEVATQILPKYNQVQIRIKKIKQDVEKLQVLLQNKDFKKLSFDTRLELRHSLEASKEMLEESMHLALPPTNLLQ